MTASQTPHQARKGIVDNPADHWRDMAGFNGELDARDNADLRRLLADEMPDTFRWLLEHGVRFYGPMPEPPHSKPRMHNVLPNSRAFITHLAKAARRAGVTIVCGARATALVTEQGRVAGVDCATADGPRRFRARGGVVLAAGDFTSDPELKGAIHGSAGGQDRRRQRDRDRRRAEACPGARRAHRQRRSRARSGIALRAAAGAQHPAEPAAVARCWPT